MSNQIPPLSKEVMGVLLGFAEDRQVQINTNPSSENGQSVHINTPYGPVELGYFSLAGTDALGAAKLVYAQLRTMVERELKSAQFQVDAYKLLLEKIPKG